MLATAGLVLAPAAVRAQAGAITVAAGGDAIVTRRLRGLVRPDVQALRTVFQDADVGFMNCEMTFRESEGHPAVTGACGDLNLTANPQIVPDLSWAGFNLTTLANNHALDYGHGGLQATLRHLHSAGLVVAGAGATLAAARAPRYVDTSSGRVGLVACASSFRAGSEASAGHAEVAGRPGLSPLRVRRRYELPADAFASLREAQRLLAPEAGQGDTDKLRFLGELFTPGATPAAIAEADADDTAAIVSQVARAAAEADVVLVTIHAHESGGSREEPAAFLRPFARACIDAGANAVLGHGPHVIRALEMYKGAPIFYSLGNLFFQAETISQIPQEIYDNCDIPTHAPSAFFQKVMGRMFEDDVYWEAVVPRLRFRERRLEALTVYPVDLHRQLPPTRRGTPGVAAAAVADRILARLQRLSRTSGTDLVVRDGVGEVVLS
jgi:poly-gamma-glutamate synthesis protein (capsule biosynthesis protein)